MSHDNQSARQVKCPQCGHLTFYSLENSFRPFCSKRCRLIDLGQWADESYRIPTREVAPLEADSAWPAEGHRDSD